MPAGRQLQAKKLFALTLISAALAACGGGGGGSGPDSVTPGQGSGSGEISTPKPSAIPATIEFVSSSSGDTTSPDDSMIIRPTSVGGITQTTLSFLVKDANGAPVANQTVNFSIETEGTGLTLLSSQPVTDKDGIAKVIVKAGDISTATSIKAALPAPNELIKSQSRELFVSTGKPHDNGASLSADNFNPEFGDWDGTEVKLTFRASDRFGNPPLDGLPVYFQTEGGIGTVGSCRLERGACTTTLTSSGLRSAISDGRQTILAYMPGEESFTDLNRNWRHDTNEAYIDIPEALLDANENNKWDIGEWFTDLNNDGIQNADGSFNGSGRNYSSTRPQSINIWRDIVITWSGSAWAGIATPSSLILCPTTGQNAIPNTITITVPLTDRNGNTLPKGTSMSVQGFTGVTLGGTTSFTVPNTSRHVTTSFTVRANSCETAAPQGAIEIKVKTPKGDDVIQNINF
ncbi:hypothetical protein EGI20_14245 [Aquitalea sp. S1-19]|nr:hypothetical protein [Aquitalea sp. S1-19]